MRKYVIGFLTGVIITAAGTAYADDIVENIIGKTIQGQFPVKISGQQLDTQAAVVDGTSYLPVRAIGEALNMDVKFDADMGIELTEKGVTKVEVTTRPEMTSIPTVPEKSIQEQIDDIKMKKNKEISNLLDQRELLKVNEDSLKNPNIPKDSAQKAIDGYKKIIADAEKRITDYEAQITALEAQK